MPDSVQLLREVFEVNIGSSKRLLERSIDDGRARRLVGEGVVVQTTATKGRVEFVPAC